MRRGKEVEDQGRVLHIRSNGGRWSSIRGDKQAPGMPAVFLSYKHEKGAGSPERARAQGR